MALLKKHLLLKVAGAYRGSVTTDELVPSGEASSFRSNPEKISEYVLCSRDAGYVGRAKEIRALETKRCETGGESGDPQLDRLLSALSGRMACPKEEIQFGSMITGEKIGDGSSREQVASCQKVLGGFANLSGEYATKRYRSNLINWGILPLRTDNPAGLTEGSFLFIENVRELIEANPELFPVAVLNAETGETAAVIRCTLDPLTEEEKRILLSGCLINYYKPQGQAKPERIH